MRKALIVGATSAIAEHVARLFAADGDRLALLARDADRLAAIADDLRVRGAAQVETLVFDATAFDRHAALIDEAAERLGGLDTVVIAHGTLSDQLACQAAFETARRELDINFLSVVSLLTPIANRFEAARAGTIAVISSVAGDRGRQSNYVYGTAKAAVSTFLEGLRNRLHRAGVRVVTIKPGFVDTPMTAGMTKNALYAAPETVAVAIHRAVTKGADVVYAPWFWWPIMTIIKLIPEPVFKRLKL
ncbi:MAG: SDR family oxidoreductase [Alphaproteobacteria bacterium]|nr:SDR family oxidoreductase [Alphaproteobacteria bacterium]